MAPSALPSSCPVKGVVLARRFGVALYNGRRWHCMCVCVMERTSRNTHFGRDGAAAHRRRDPKLGWPRRRRPRARPLGTAQRCQGGGPWRPRGIGRIARATGAKTPPVARGGPLPSPAGRPGPAHALCGSQRRWRGGGARRAQLCSAAPPRWRARLAGDWPGSATGSAEAALEPFQGTGRAAAGRRVDEPQASPGRARPGGPRGWRRPHGSEAWRRAGDRGGGVRRGKRGIERRFCTQRTKRPRREAPRAASKPRGARLGAPLCLEAARPSLLGARATQAARPRSSVGRTPSASPRHRLTPRGTVAGCRPAPSEKPASPSAKRRAMAG